MCEKSKCKNCGNCKNKDKGEDEVLTHTKHLDEKNAEDYIKWYNSMVNLSYTKP